MSALERTSLEQEETPQKRTLARLAAVPEEEQKKAWPRGVFPVTILALLAGGLVGHLVLQTAIQAQGFELADLQAQAANLSAQQSILEATLDTQSTSQQLAFVASSLGMVANPYSTFIDLSTSEVTGVNKPVRGDEVPAISAPPALTQDTAPIDSVQQASGAASTQAATDDQEAAEAESVPVDQPVEQADTEQIDGGEG